MSSNWTARPWYLHLCSAKCNNQTHCLAFPLLLYCLVLHTHLHLIHNCVDKTATKVNFPAFCGFDSSQPAPLLNNGHMYICNQVYVLMSANSNLRFWLPFWPDLTTFVSAESETYYLGISAWNVYILGYLPVLPFCSCCSPPFHICRIYPTWRVHL